MISHMSYVQRKSQGRLLFPYQLRYKRPSGVRRDFLMDTHRFSTFGGFLKWGYFQNHPFFSMENFHCKHLVWRTPIPGNPHCHVSSVPPCGRSQRHGLGLGTQDMWVFWLVVEPYPFPHMSIDANIYLDVYIYIDEWLVVDLPLWNIWKSIGMMIIPNIWKNISHVPNHQPEYVCCFDEHFTWNRWKGTWIFQWEFISPCPMRYAKQVTWNMACCHPSPSGYAMICLFCPGTGGSSKDGKSQNFQHSLNTIP